MDLDMPTHAGSSDSRAQLARAFARWANARTQLDQLRGQVASGAAGRQFAPTPEAAALFDSVARQEAECAQLWQELASLDEELAAAREAPWIAGERGRVHQRSDDAAIEAVASAGEAPVNILLVDDETANLSALEAVLDDPGYRLVRAASAQEALLAVITGEFACLLLDVQMPGMSGFELARLINERRNRAPIIFLTAHYQEDRHALEGYASGAVDYVHKPFQPAVLRQKVAVFADLYRATRRMQQRAGFLAEAGRVLARSMDLDRAISAVLDLCVPVLGDGAVLGFAGQDGEVQRLEIHPALAARDADALRTELGVETARAIRSREVRLWRSGERAAAICPLVTGDGASAALWILGQATSFDATRIALVREFAFRAATVLENARLNAIVQEAERSSDKFLAMLAHELRNPLAPISNAVQIIRTQSPPQSTIDWACEVIGRQATQLGRLVDDLLEAGRLAHGKVAVSRETLTLADIVQGAAASSEPQLRQRKQAIAIDLPSEAIDVQGDAARLVQALSNLIGNASKFSDQGTTILITAAYAAGQARICVKDDGAGIAPEFLPHAFDLFAQGEQSLDRPHGGLGVGLALVRHIVELHGGRVSAHSAGLGQGTEVSVQLPAQPAAS